MIILATASSLLSTILVLSIQMAQAVDFDTHFVELDNAKMITTGEGHFAISSPSLPSNWRSVSVNVGEVVIATKDNQILNRKYNSLTVEERTQLESIRNLLLSVIRSGPFHAKSQTGLAKLTTFDRHGGTSSMGAGGGGSSSSSSSASSSSGGGMSLSRSGPGNFIVSKPNFANSWQRVFVNEDLDTIVYQDARVIMLPEGLLKSEEKTQMIALRQEVDKASKAAEKLTADLSSSLRNPFDFVNKALGGIFG